MKNTNKKKQLLSRKSATKKVVTKPSPSLRALQRIEAQNTQIIDLLKEQLASRKVQADLEAAAAKRFGLV